MARTIGKVRIKKLKRIVEEEYQKHIKDFYMIDYTSLSDAIRERIPSEWYEIWECGFQEINRVCDDEVTKLRYNK